MANTLITQEPAYNIGLVGQNLYYSVTNDQDVATETKVKFCAEVYISNDAAVDFSNPASPDFVGIFKTTPNNTGVGMWDMRNITETYVSSDNLGAEGSAYKLQVSDKNYQPPLQNINQYSLTRNMVGKLRIRFYTEYLGADPNFPNVVRPSVNTVISPEFLFINGYVKFTDTIQRGSVNTGHQFDYLHNIGTHIMQASNLMKYLPKFLSNAPTTTFCNMEDYGTLSALMNGKTFTYLQLRYRKDGITIGSDAVFRNTSTGAWTTWNGKCEQRILHFGCYPANLRGWSETWQQIYQNMYCGSIEIRGYLQAQGSSTVVTEVRTININPRTLKGYEPIRLKWINQYGAWDYFTFNMKSTRKISTDSSTYTQLDGTWNERNNKMFGYRGGTKQFRVNAIEKITMNTDYISEDFNTTFEELKNSPEVYMIKGYQNDTGGEALTKYSIPVRLTSSDFTYKTKANDKLVQYEFEIEKSETLRTQAI